MEKNRLEKVRKYVFYKHTNIVTKKWVGKKREEKIFKKHTNRVSKNCWKKIVSKKCEKMFFNKNMNIETLNGGEKSEKKIFSETHVLCEL